MSIVVGMDVDHPHRYVIVMYAHREHSRLYIYRLLSDGGKKKKPLKQKGQGKTC